MPHFGQILCIANHPSTIGIFAGLVAVFWPWVIKFMEMVPVIVAKWKYVRWTGPLRLILFHFNVIAVRDKTEVGKRKAVVRAEVDVLTNTDNCALWLFAEGTRTEFENELLGRFNPGVGRVVAEARPTIVFVWDQGSSLACPKGSWPRWQIKWLRGFIPLPCRQLVTISISRPISAADPTTHLYWLCQQGKPEEVAQKVADYLHDLCWGFAVSNHPELTSLVNEEVLGDLAKITLITKAS